MKTKLLRIAPILTLLVVLLIGSLWRSTRAEQPEVEVPPVAYAWGNQVTVYYPTQQRIFVYSELGGSCVFMYTLSSPGGPLTRQNCK